MSLKHLLVVAALASTARADVNAAAKAFSEGQAAQLAGDFDRAAQNYELAYSIVPSKEALRSAVRARMLGQQLPRAATLAELLLANYADDAASAKLANEVITQAKSKLARVQLACSAPCTAAIDGKGATVAASTAPAFYVPQGVHDLDIVFEGDVSVKRKIDGEPGVAVELKVEKPAPKVVPPPPPPPVEEHREPPPPPPVSHHGGLPKWVAIGGGAVTVAFAGITIWSGFDTWKAHDAYAKNPTDAAFNEGVKKQDRTNGLLLATAGLGIATGVVAVFFTKWHTDEELPVTVTAGAHGASASYQFRF
jgi:hypothetical protein